MSDYVHVERLRELLQEAHDKMDEWNNENPLEEPDGTHIHCWWCDETDYDYDGIKHKEYCILVKIRKAT